LLPADRAAAAAAATAVAAAVPAAAAVVLNEVFLLLQRLLESDDTMTRAMQRVGVAVLWHMTCYDIICPLFDPLGGCRIIGLLVLVLAN
jgi:hypothetical protein